MASTTNRYLDQALERLKLPSDYALANVLDVTTQAIYKMRAGGAMSTTTAAKIAELLELDPMQVIADVELERASRPGERELWQRIRDAAVVAALAIGAASFGMPPDAGAATRGGLDITVAEYTLRTNRRRSSFEAFVAWILGR